MIHTETDSLTERSGKETKKIRKTHCQIRVTVYVHKAVPSEEQHKKAYGTEKRLH